MDARFRSVAPLVIGSMWPALQAWKWRLALARKRRSLQLTPPEAARALARLQRDLNKRLRVVEITPALLTDAMALADKHSLRGYDAVQLASTIITANRRRKLKLPLPIFVTADSELIAAAIAEGLPTDDPNNH